MTLTFLYRLSLESRGHWFMFFGAGPDSRPDEPPQLSVQMFYAFTLGLVAAQSREGRPDPEFREFLDSLRAPAGELSKPGGWAARYLAEAGGSDVDAIALFLSRVQDFALDRKAPWLLKLNAGPLPSQLTNGLGQPLRADVRIPEHVAFLEPFQPR